ncbi:hypothetical protein F5X96DRAFT_694200 [Biscogniauxia mediterranea]|nr:hypothetical protein F5X96DRAFT_694200 [Biscogniauxia mediterranea]
MDEAMLDDILGANTDAVTSNNNAYSAMQAGRFDEAIKLHEEALALKLRAYPESSTQVGISLNGLGEALLRAGELEEADKALERALSIREKHGPALDAAATRENIAALREAQGKFDEAREMRLRGSKQGQMLCGHYGCPTNQMCTRGQLRCCSACTAVFYCTKQCQVQDWKARHKPLCKAPKKL